MNILTNESPQNFLSDYLNPKSSRTDLPVENATTSSPNHSRTSNDHLSLQQLQAQQTREFVYGFITGKIIGKPANNINFAQEYPPYVKDKQSLQQQLSNFVKQRVIYSPDGKDANTLAKTLDEGFQEVTAILISSNNLPETLQTEFTNMHHSLSDFIKQLNDLAASGLNPESISNSSPLAIIKTDNKTGNSVNNGNGLVQNQLKEKSNIYRDLYYDNSITSHYIA